MGFSVDHSQANDILPEGEYEVIIGKVKQAYTKRNAQYINVPLIIRNDVDGNQRKNGRIWHSIWKKRQPTAADAACEGYTAWAIQGLSKAAGLPNGKAYSSIDEWCADLEGRLMRVTLTHRKNDEGNINVNVQHMNPTQFPTCNHTAKQGTPEVSAAGFVEMADDTIEDVPF